MGFGILFFGYLISFNTIAYPGFTKIIAYLVMLLAMTRLGQYNRDLKAAYYTLIPGAAIGALYFLAEIASMFSLLPEKEMTLLFRLIPLAIAILELLFLFRLLRGLQALAKETEVPMLEVASFRNRLFIVGYHLLYILGQLDYGEQMAYFLACYNLAILLVGFVVMFLNAKLFYNFYMWICLPGDEDMKRKTSKNRLLDKLYEKMDEMEERKLKRRQEQDLLRRSEKEAKRKEHKRK